MADIKISALPTATTPLTGAELVPVVQGGVTKQTTTSDLLAAPATSLTASSAVATDASKKLVSVANTGTGSNVLATGPTLVAPALGTPASGTVTNLTGTASININGTVGATTPAAVSATALSYSTTLTGGTGIVNLGSGQFYKDASGNVGIGTASPGYDLDVNKSSAIVTARVTTTANGFADSVLGTWGLDRARIRAEAANPGAGSGTGSGALSFWTARNPTMTEAMRIDGSGNVGVGTSAPNAKFVVQGGRSTFAANSETFSVYLQYNNATAGVYVGSPSANAFQISGSGGNAYLNIDSSGNVTVSTAALLGYGTGSGGTVTQATSKSTAVTLNKPTGIITMNNAALAGNTTVFFQVNNSLIGANDSVILTLGSFAGNGYNNQIWPFAVVAGSFYIALRNITGGSLSEAIAINFAVIKGATS